MPGREELLLAEMQGTTVKCNDCIRTILCYFVKQFFNSFSELTAAILLHKGIKVYRFSKISPTPFVVSLCLVCNETHNNILFSSLML